MEDVIKFLVIAVVGLVWGRIRKRIDGAEDPDPEPLAPDRPAETAGTELPQRAGSPGPAEVRPVTPSPAEARPPAPRRAAGPVPGGPGPRPAWTSAEGVGSEGVRSEGFGTEGVRTEGLASPGVRAEVVRSNPLSTLRSRAESAAPPAPRAGPGAGTGSAGDARRSALALLATRQGLAQAVLLAEVLGKPRALRPWGRR